MDVSVNVSFKELVRLHVLTDIFRDDISNECSHLGEAITKLKSQISTEEISEIETSINKIQDILSNSQNDLKQLSGKISEYERFIARLKFTAGGFSFNTQVSNSERVITSSVPNLGSTQQTYTNAIVNGQSMSVYDHPESLGQQLKSRQGINNLNKVGTCSLVSAANVLKIGGVSESENSIVNNATAWGLCSKSGGTDPSFTQLSSIMKRYGVDTQRSTMLSPEGLARIVENGHGTIISVDSAVLWDEPSLKIFPSVDHAVTVTSVARNPKSGQIEGFYICDSGRCQSSDASRFVDIKTMQRAHFNARNHGALYTQNIIW